MTWKMKILVWFGVFPAAALMARPPEPPASAADQIEWLRYNDSAEGAFTMDVPLGWQIQGGMYRFGYFDVRWMMGVRSLDGKIIIRISDVNIPAYVLPSPSTGREGQPYTKPQQFQMVVAKYQEPGPYAELYAKHRFSEICKTMTPAAAGWKPTVPATWGDPNGRASDGDVAYNCDSSDGPRIASVYSRNTVYQGQGYSFWMAMPVSILCAPDRCEQARSMTQHMMESFEKNPQWVAYQNQLTQVGLAQIRASFGQFMQQMQQFHQQFTQSMNQQVAGYYARQNAQARQVSGWCDTINGLANVRDPKTGSQFQVFSGPKSNYYINGLGVKVNSNISPGPEFHQLEVIENP